MRRSVVGTLLLMVAPMLVLPEPSGRPPRWQDSLTTRLEALAVLQTLNADLLSHDSATMTLDRWCEAHHMAMPPRIIADRMAAMDKAPTAQQREELVVSASEPVRYREVRLRCGDRVLSQAENWYVPGRLTPEMNRLLETTDAPFGRVVQSLHFWRHLLDATLLWSPLPPGWDSDREGSPPRLAAWPDEGTPVLRHRAVLVLPDGQPISEVVETYTAAVLAFPEPLPENARGTSPEPPSTP